MKSLDLITAPRSAATNLVGLCDPQTGSSKFHAVGWINHIATLKFTVTLAQINIHSSYLPCWCSTAWKRPSNSSVTTVEISQIPKCSHPIPFRTEMCPFLFKILHYGIWNKCSVVFVNKANPILLTSVGILGWKPLKDVQVWKFTPPLDWKTKHWYGFYPWYLSVLSILLHKCLRGFP